MDVRLIAATNRALEAEVVTAWDSVEERVAGLDAGAHDYMVKPFALAEVSARLRALLRRGQPTAYPPSRGGWSWIPPRAS